MKKAPRLSPDSLPLPALEARRETAESVRGDKATACAGRGHHNAGEHGIPLALGVGVATPRTLKGPTIVLDGSSGTVSLET